MPTLVAPDETFSLRGVSAGEPAGEVPPTRHPIAAVTTALDAGWRRDAVVAVDRDRRVLALRSGAEISYEILIVAVGALAFPAFDHGVLFDHRLAPESMDALLLDVRSGRAGSVAVVVPRRCPWTLPAYELAFLLAASKPRAARSTRRRSLTIVTAEPEPLAAFGAPAADMVRTELEAAGIDLVCGLSARVPSGRIVALGRGRRLRVDRVVHLPEATGPWIAGLPHDADGFIPVGTDLHVAGYPDVFAVGGCAAGVGQGGLAAIQAHAVAGTIARRAGCRVDAEPYRSELRALLHTGRGARYLYAAPPGGAGACLVSEACPSWPPSDAASPWLGRWLTAAQGVGRGALDGPGWA